MLFGKSGQQSQLFGNGQTRSQQPATSTGIFGGSLKTSAGQPVSASTGQQTTLFGKPAPGGQSQGQGQQTSLFGNAFQGGGQTSNSIFSGLSTTAAQAQPSGSLFGGTTTTTSGQAGQQGGLAGGGLFGQSANQQPSSSGLFGSSRPTELQQHSIFGGTLGGATAATQPNTTPAATTTTRESNIGNFGSQTGARTPVNEKRFATETPNPTFSNNAGLFGDRTVFGTAFSGGNQTAQTAATPLSASATVDALGTSRGSIKGNFFFPARPSLRDLLKVAPDWEPQVRKVIMTVAERDCEVDSVKTVLRRVVMKCGKQKDLLQRKIEENASLTTTLERIEHEIETMYPILQKTHRQCNGLQKTFNRASANNASTSQIIVVPHADFLQLIRDMQERLESLKAVGQSLDRSIRALESDSQSARRREHLKTCLRLQLEQLKLLKNRLDRYSTAFRALGCHQPPLAFQESTKVSH